MGNLASKRQLESEEGRLQVQGRPVGSFKWTRQDVAKSMERHVYESGWCLDSDAPMKHRQSSFQAMADALGIPKESLRRILLEIGGYSKEKIRDGLCDYCYHFRTCEKPLTERIFQILAEKLVRVSLLFLSREQSSVGGEGARGLTGGFPTTVREGGEAWKFSGKLGRGT